MTGEEVKPDPFPPQPKLKPADPYGDTQYMSAMAPRVAVAWLKREFSRTSVMAILAVLVSCGGYFFSLTVRLNDVEHRLNAMNERVPTGDTNQRTNEEIAHVREQVAGLVEKTAQQERHLDNTDEQIQRIYKVFDPDEVASIRPFAKRNRK